MPKLKPYIALFLLLCAANAFSQDNAWYIYLDDLESEAVEYSFGADNKGASFYLYRKGYETKAKRDSIKQIQIERRDKNRKKLLLSKKTPPTGTNFYTSNSPERIESLAGLDIISPDEYREDKIKSKVPSEIYILTHCKDGAYLKWEVVIMPYE